MEAPGLQPIQPCLKSVSAHNNDAAPIYLKSTAQSCVIVRSGGGVTVFNPPCLLVDYIFVCDLLLLYYIDDPAKKIQENSKISPSKPPSICVYELGGCAPRIAYLYFPKNFHNNCIPVKFFNSIPNILDFSKYSDISIISSILRIFYGS